VVPVTRIPDRQQKRFRPKSRKRVRYYKASLAIAVVFVVCAIGFPLWYDQVKRSRDRDLLERDMESVPAVPIPAYVPPQLSGASAGGPGAAGIAASAPGALFPRGNPQCQAWVQARCDALSVSTERCARILRTAEGVPANAGDDACRKAVDKALADATGSANETGAGTGSIAGQGSRAQTESGTVPGEPVAAQGREAKEADAGAAPQPTAPAIDPETRAKNRARMAELVEQYQRASWNYSTQPAAQSARLAELRSLAQQDGTQEAVDLYNNLLKKGTPFAPGPAAGAGEKPRVQSPSAPASGATPEIEAARRLASDARASSGRRDSPAPAPASMSTGVQSVSPGQVQSVGSINP